MMPERREDDASRDRISALARAWRSWQEVMERRYRRLAQALVVVVTIAILSAVGGWIVLDRAQGRLDVQQDTLGRQQRSLRDVARQLNGERWRASYAACLERNARSTATVGLLEDLHVSEPTIEVARRRFPTTRNCRDYVRALYVGPQPPGAFDVPQVVRRGATRGEP